MNPWDGGVLLLSIKQREKKLRIFHHSRTVIFKPHFVSLIEMRFFSSGFSIFFSGSFRNYAFLLEIGRSCLGYGVVFWGHVKFLILFSFYFLIKSLFWFWSKIFLPDQNISGLSQISLMMKTPIECLLSNFVFSIFNLEILQRITSYSGF